jgi:hypothetical protein
MLVCIDWQDMVLEHPPLWSWIYMDAEVGDLEARMAVCTTLSASQPLHLNLYLPYSPSFIELIRPYIHRIHSVVVHMPMDLKMEEAVDHISKMVRYLHLDHLSFRFLKGGEDVFYSPANMEEILEKYSRNRHFASPRCPSNMITALTLSTPNYRQRKEHRLSLHTLLTWLSLNVHLVYLKIDSVELTMEREKSLPSMERGKARLTFEAEDPPDDRGGKSLEKALPIVSLLSLRTIIIEIKEKTPMYEPFLYRHFHRQSEEVAESEDVMVVFLRHIRSPNPITIDLTGNFSSLCAAIYEMGVGLQPSIVTLSFGNGNRGRLDVGLERIRKALSSVRYLHILSISMPMQIIQLVQCLPRSAVLRITNNSYYDELASLVDHPPHLIQLNYIHRRRDIIGKVGLPSLPAWCWNTHRFDSLLLEGYGIGLIAPLCRRLLLVGTQTSETFVYFRTSLYIEELQSDSEVYVRNKYFFPKVGGLDNLSKVTCTLSFAVLLLRWRHLPMLRELILINGRQDKRFDETLRGQWQLFSSLLTESINRRAPMRLLSIPVWMPWLPLFGIPKWLPLFEISKLLSEGNERGITSTLVLPSLPHPRILGPLVDSLNGELVTEVPDLPSWKSKEQCDLEGICHECHNGGWVCADVNRCQRGRRGEPAAITRYTLSK